METSIKRVLFYLAFVAWGVSTIYASDHYAKITVTSTGHGQVYISDDATENIASLADSNWSSDNGSKTEVLKKYGRGDQNIDAYAYAKSLPGYSFKCWSSNSSGTTDVKLNNPQIYTITAKTDNKDNPTDCGTIYASFESVLYQYSTSYELPSTGGHFTLVSRGQNRFLQVSPSTITTTTDTADATVFHISSNSSSTLKYEYGSTIYYVGHLNGNYSYLGGDNGDPTTDANKIWTIEDQRTNQDGYYFKNKNTDDWRFLYGGGIGVWFPKGGDCVNYNRSWALVPVFLFHTTAPTGLVGGTQTWSVANAKKIPLSSDDFSGQSTTATFAASPSTNYHFAGWWDNSSYDGDAVLSDASYTNETITNSNCAETLRYYAKFVPYFNFSGVAPHNVEGCSVEISYSPSGTPIEGGVYIDGINSDQESQDCTITFTATTDEYHNFAGWYDNADFEGDFISMSATIDTTVTNSIAGSTCTVTLYPKFVTEKVPVFTWNYSSVIAGENYPDIFATTNPDNSFTITSDNEDIAEVRSGTLYAKAEGTVHFTVNQVSGNNWIEHEEVFTVIVNPTPDWKWISEEPANGNFYIRIKGSSLYMNNDNTVGDANIIWTLTKTGETLSIKNKANASEFLEVLCVQQNAGFNLSRFRVYSNGTQNTDETDSKFTKTTLTLGGSSENGYALFADDINYGGLSSQRRDVFVYVDDNNALIPQNGDGSFNIWEFISKAQYDARVAYQNAVTFAATADNHLSNSLRSELNTVMTNNNDASTNYKTKDFSTCKTNLDNIVAKCSTYVANLEAAESLHCDKSGNGYYMFYHATKDARLGDDVQAYTASWSGNSLVLTAVPNQVIPAATVALVYSNSKSVFYYALEDPEASSISGNAFVHHDESYNSIGQHTDYILSAIRNPENDEIIDYYAFRKYTGSSHDTLLKDKNVLVWTSSPLSAPSMFNIFTEENIATALVPVYEDNSTVTDSQKCTKLLIDGKLYIKQDNTLYDVLGRKVQ